MFHDQLIGLTLNLLHGHGWPGKLIQILSIASDQLVVCTSFDVRMLFWRAKRDWWSERAEWLSDRLFRRCYRWGVLSVFWQLLHQQPSVLLLFFNKIVVRLSFVSSDLAQDSIDVHWVSGQVECDTYILSHPRVVRTSPSFIFNVPFSLFNDRCKRFLRRICFNGRSDWPRALPLQTQVIHRGNKAWVETTRRSGFSGLRARSFIFVSHVNFDCRLILKRLIFLSFDSIITRCNERVVSASWS